MWNLIWFSIKNEINGHDCQWGWPSVVCVNEFHFSIAQWAPRCRNTQLLCIDLVIFSLDYEENTKKYKKAFWFVNWFVIFMSWFGADSLTKRTWFVKVSDPLTQKYTIHCIVHSKLHRYFNNLYNFQLACEKLFKCVWLLNNAEHYCTNLPSSRWKGVSRLTRFLLFSFGMAKAEQKGTAVSIRITNL